MIKAFILNCDAEVSTCIYAAKKKKKWEKDNKRKYVVALSWWMDG